MTPETVRELTNLYAKMFIQRRDVVAVQFDKGYMPLMKGKEYVPFSRDVIESHINGTATYGHYVVGEDDTTKLLVIDIDLKKEGWLPTVALHEDPDDQNYADWAGSFAYCPDLRSAWHNRKAVHARAYLKTQMRQLASIFTAPISSYLGVHTAAAYSGNKGIHVYGFVGAQPAAIVRESAELIMDTVEWLSPLKGHHFFGDSRGPVVPTGPDGKAVPTDFPAEADPFNFFNFHFEVFPKQISLDGKKLGNLVRLPLGVNLQAPKNPTFFIDLTSPLNRLAPVDPIWALTTKDPWGNPPSA